MLCKIALKIESSVFFKISCGDMPLDPLEKLRFAYLLHFGTEPSYPKVFCYIYDVKVLAVISWKDVQYSNICKIYILILQ